MTVLVDKDTRSYFDCTPHAQEARIKIKHAMQRHEQTELTETKSTMSLIKNTLDGITGRSDITE